MPNAATDLREPLRGDRRHSTDLGLERAGHTCVGQVELDPFATKVLEKHWPAVPRIRDVRDFHGHEFGPFDLLTGGYPCQPFSVAGSRRGEHDPRHLWPEVHRIIRNVRPRFVLLENVPGHLSLGFGRVLGDLAESGYDAEWDCIPAAAVGAPHLRDRVFILAHANDAGQGNGRPEPRRRTIASRGSTQLADADLPRLEGRVLDRRRASQRLTRARRESHARYWLPEPDVGRVAHGVPNRVERLRALGNAVVPQVAQFIGERLMEATR